MQKQWWQSHGGAGGFTQDYHNATAKYLLVTDGAVFKDSLAIFHGDIWNSCLQYSQHAWSVWIFVGIVCVQQNRPIIQFQIPNHLFTSSKH
jgi:hypothetical protein